MSDELTTTNNDEMPAFLKDKQNDSRGKESGVDARDRILPRLKLLHKTTEDKGEEGAIVHSITGQSFGIPFQFISVFHYKEYFKWEKKKLVFKTRDPKDERIKPGELEWSGTKEKPIPPAIQTTLQFLVVPVETLEPVILSFAKTSYQTGVQLINMIDMTNGPAFQRIYSVETAKAPDKDYDYQMLVSARPLGYVDEKQFAAAEKSYDNIVPLLKSGKIVAEDESNGSQKNETTTTAEANADF